MFACGAHLWGTGEGDYMFPAMKFFRVSAYESLKQRESLARKPSKCPRRLTGITYVHIYIQTDVRLFHIPLGLFSEIYKKIKGYGVKQNTMKFYICNEKLKLKN